MLNAAKTHFCKSLFLPGGQINLCWRLKIQIHSKMVVHNNNSSFIVYKLTTISPPEIRHNTTHLANTFIHSPQSKQKHSHARSSLTLTGKIIPFDIGIYICVHLYTFINSRLSFVGVSYLIF